MISEGDIQSAEVAACAKAVLTNFLSFVMKTTPTVVGGLKLHQILASIAHDVVKGFYEVSKP